MHTFAERAIAFYRDLPLPAGPLPESVQVLDPYQIPETQRVVSAFYEKYFSDTRSRVLVLGINPGRFGGGATGIPFTDPDNLRLHCGIAHTLVGASELSSRFVYACIGAFGGTEAFYSRFCLGAVYPLALVKNGKNYNYYDHPAVSEALRPAIGRCLARQAAFGCRPQAVCLGLENARHLERFNRDLKVFGSIRALPHPRFVMQYRSHQRDRYIDQYLVALTAAEGET